MFNKNHFLYFALTVCFTCSLIPTSSAKTDLDLASSHFVNPEYSKRISMDFKDASLIDVLKIFSKQSGMNFIASQDVSSKKITLFLENIPVEEALEKILKANDLVYEIQQGSDIFIVKGINSQKKTVTRVYQLKHATVPSSLLNKTISLSEGGSSSADSKEGILAAIKAVISKEGSLIEDSRTNSLIITDDESRFPLIEATIAQLDVPIAEILIEVEMLDVSKVNADKIGVQWGNTMFKAVGGSKPTLFPFNQSAPFNDKTVVVDEEGEPLPYETGMLDFKSMQATVQFLRTRTDTKNLARPRLLTLNNQTAQIKISTKEAIGITENVTTGTSSSANSVTAERVETGVFLTVTPQANLESGEIIMALYPKVIQARTGATFEGRSFKDPEERGSQSYLKVKDGETIVIGGLLRTDETDTITKVPVLGDIPFLGNAFRHKGKDGSERELIIFLTPHILTDKNKAKILREQSQLTNFDAISEALSNIENQRF